jgi:ABC-type lipoprotein release transport system permease subunit
LERLGLTRWTRRLETFGLVASETATEGTFVIGLDPERESEVTRLHEKVTHGRFFVPDDSYSCVLGATAARNLGVGLGDELVLVAYDRYGVMSAEAFEVIGIIASGEMGIDRGLLLTTLQALQEMLEMGDLVTNIPVSVAADRLDQVTGTLRTSLAGQDLEIMRWHDMFPVMKEWVTVHNGFLYLFLAVVLFIVLAGVLNTMLLSMLDRVREFGVFLALGNRHRDISLLVLVESLLIGVAGVALGSLFGLFLVGVTAYTGMDMSAIVGNTQRFYVDPVIRPSLNLTHLLSTVLLVLAITALAGVYPAWRAGRLTPAEAIRHV